MGFAKFVDLLQRQALFFARADKLGDEFEGSWPKAGLESRREAFKKLVGHDIDGKTLSEFFKIQRKFTVVNCWHLNEHESAAMWKLYQPSGDGIAIRSTCGHLRKSSPQTTLALSQYVRLSISTLKRNQYQLVSGLHSL